MEIAFFSETVSLDGNFSMKTGNFPIPSKQDSACNITDFYLRSISVCENCERFCNNFDLTIVCINWRISSLLFTKKTAKQTQLMQNGNGIEERMDWSEEERPRLKVLTLRSR